MKKYSLSAITLFLLVFLLFMHIYGMSNYLYLRISFYDLIAHILGGMCIALSAFYVLRNPKHIIWITIIAGIAWEIFEVYFDIAGWPTSSILYKIDTIKDILNDTLGAIIIWIAIKKFKK